MMYLHYKGERRVGMTEEKIKANGKYTFESVTKETKAAADVTIYSNGMVRFGKQAIEKYDIRNTALLWGTDNENGLLVLRKVRNGRNLRGKSMDTTSCPLRIAQDRTGKYTLTLDGDVLVLTPIG